MYIKIKNGRRNVGIDIQRDVYEDKERDKERKTDIVMQKDVYKCKEREGGI